MSSEKKKDTCVGQKGKNGKRKRKGGVEEKEEEENREMILGEEHWKRWQERNQTPFVSFPHAILSVRLQCLFMGCIYIIATGYYVNIFIVDRYRM